MVIDRRRTRLGRSRQVFRLGKATTLTAVAIAVQSIAGSAHAQLAAPGSGNPNDAGQQVTQSSGGATAPGNGGAPRDPWRFVPSIGIDETYSDNINLSTPGSERSDLVTSISPSFRLTRFGSHLTAVFNYNPQYLIYARGSNGAQLRNYLDARADATLVDNFLFFNSLISVTQSNISPFGAQSANTVNGSGNRAETRNYSLGPTLRSRFGRDFSYSAGYQFSGSSSDNSAYGASHINQLYGQFQSGTSFSDLGYGADLSRTSQSYGNSGQIVQETAGGTLTYVLVPTFHLRGRIGYDRNSYPTTDQPDLKGPSYSGGFDWNPSQHTQASVQVGHRYFGPTANITLRETTNKIAVTALYSRDQTTSSANGLTLVTDPNYALLDQFFRATIPDPALRAQAVVSALQQAGLPTSQFGTAGFLSNQLFLQKTAQLSVALLGLRNTVTFDAVRSESQALSNVQFAFDVFDSTQRFRTTSFNANWSHKLGPRTNANFTASQIHSQAVQGIGDTKQYLLTASINRQFQPKLSGNVMVRHTNQIARGQSGGGGSFFSGSYRENAVLGSLRLTF